MILLNGNKWGTGALINTTADNYHPYLLTAHHLPNKSGYDAVANNSPFIPQLMFYWHYESPTCPNAFPAIRTTVGAKLVANNSISDFALFDLSGYNSDPRMRNDVTPYFLGWDFTEYSGTGGVCIHHPQGDIKKIATYTTTPRSTAELDDFEIWHESFWRVVWEPTTHNGVTKHGVTEKYSSGSPLINSNRKVIGQLRGGYASCDLKNSPDWYGKLQYTLGRYSVIIRH